MATRDKDLVPVPSCLPAICYLTVIHTAGADNEGMNCICVLSKTPFSIHFLIEERDYKERCMSAWFVECTGIVAVKLADNAILTFMQVAIFVLEALGGGVDVDRTVMLSDCCLFVRYEQPLEILPRRRLFHGSGLIFWLDLFVKDRSCDTGPALTEATSPKLRARVRLTDSVVQQ